MQSWRDLRTLPRPLWTLFFATLVNRTGTMALPFLVLYLIRDVGFSPAKAGAVLSAYGAVALIAGPLAGRLVDRVGSLRVMKAALAVTGLLQLLFPLARSPLSVIALAGLWSLAAETYRPAAMSATAELVPEERRREAFALIRLAINLGMSIGPAVGGLLASWDFRLIFAVDGLTSLLAAALMFLSRLPAGAITPSKATSPPLAQVMAPLRNPAMAAFLSVLLCNAMVVFQGDSAMAVFLVDDLGLSTKVYGLLFTLNTVIIVILEIPLTAHLRRYDTRRMLALGVALSAVGFGALGLVTGIGGVLATVVIWTFGEMVFSPTSAAYVADLAPEGERGQYMGLYAAAHSLAFIFSAALGLWSLEHLGRAHWAVVGAVGLLATGVFLGTTRAAPRRA